MIKITETVKHLVIINVLFWLGTIAIGTNGDLFNKLFAFHFPLSQDFEFWQIITHMFMHASYTETIKGVQITISHLLFNMLALWMFGSAVEQVFGRNKFLFLYFSAGFGALLLSFSVTYFDFKFEIDALLNNGFNQGDIISLLNEGKYDKRWLSFVSMDTIHNFSLNFRGIMLGASGAIMGVLVAFGMLFPNSELMLLFFPVPVKAKYFIPVLIGLDVFSGLTGISIFSPSNTAYWAHIGGALTGLLMMLYWKKTQFNKNRWN